MKDATPDAMSQWKDGGFDASETPPEVMARWREIHSRPDAPLLMVDAIRRMKDELSEEEFRKAMYGEFVTLPLAR